LIAQIVRISHGFTSNGLVGVHLNSHLKCQNWSRYLRYWPALLVLAILAHPIVHITLGQAWDEACPLVQILSVAADFCLPDIVTFAVLVAMGANR
jgi:hypothetical protein